MGRKEELLEEIIEIEWNMLQNVANIGGKASCQEDPATFRVMRTSQGISWSEDTLQSYLSDLKEAESKGRNLLSEKYARMMESTSPSEYANIAHLIPPMDPEVPPLIDQIVKIMLDWEEETSQKFPYLRSRGRPIHRSEDSQMVTSFETYLRGELQTYSKKTLELYYKNISEQKSKHINPSEVVLEQTVRQYGYKSLEEANQKLKERMT
jgi:hypothetical protein